MMDMVERVARALEAAFDRDGRVFDQGQALDLARAAIGAMREPTDKMMADMLDDDIVGYTPDPADHKKVWHAGIDAALKP